MTLKAENRTSLDKKGRVRMNVNHTMLVLGACCIALTVGYSWNEKRWGPWLMLRGIMSLMGA
ncbi:MAG: hypothetical protein RR687_05945 [Comamonas sp.]